jgi:hypothetical protein
MLGRLHTSAHLACVAFGEFVLSEFFWAADLDWRYGSWGEDDAPGDDRAAWDEAHPDPTAMDLGSLSLPDVENVLQCHFRDIAVSDPEEMIDLARGEIAFVRGLPQAVIPDGLIEEQMVILEALGKVYPSAMKQVTLAGCKMKRLDGMKVSFSPKTLRKHLEVLRGHRLIRRVGKRSGDVVTEEGMKLLASWRNPANPANSL